MKKTRASIFTLWVILLLACAFVPVKASAGEPPVTVSSSGTNPLYGELEEELAEEALPRTFAVEEEKLGASSVPSYSSVEDAGEYLRRQMISRSTSISFKITTTTQNAQTLFEKVFEKALEASADSAPNAGDYLRWHWRRYAYDCAYKESAGKTVYQYYMNVVYLSTASQEAAVTSQVKSVLSSLGIGRMENEYEIVKAIHDYVTQHVSYDHETLEDDSPGKYTAYNALIKGTAVCQGYANLIYRMMRESGLMVRLVGGSSFGEPHAWNIVRLNGKYYNLDSTWDAGVSPDGYQYFLINKDVFDRTHFRDDLFRSSAFNSAHPMAAGAYIPTSAKAVNYSIKYVLNGGVNNTKNPSKFFNQAVTLAAPGRKGYRFVGWYIDKAMTKKITKIPVYAAKGYTLYAKWAKITVPRTTLKAYRSTKKYLYVYFKQVPGASAYRVAYSTVKSFSPKTTKFALVQSGTSRGVVKLPKTSGSPKRYYVRIRAFKVDSAGKRIYGAYSAATSGKKITYKLNGGVNNVHNVRYRHNYKVTLKAPTRKGYTFRGWYRDSKYKRKITNISKASTRNYTLYAKWKKKN